MAAYALCVRDDQLLLSRGIDGRGRPEWTLPGGGVEHGEDPYDAAVREVEEETGYHVDLTALLGVDSIRLTTRRRLGRSVDRHGIRLVYEGRVTGGELRHEIGGSTDMAAWHPLETVAGLPRVALVDVGLALWRERPAAGRVNSFQYPAT
ncbi:hypothetical protein GCM10010276_47810 [Streptomyces longisporus]|uniref:Nudix hydrolase domain-containing protein n=1 Tax=Streptomyces longisporus TaxID=1948 RepID=A0ABN3MFF9_STRLO